MTERNNTLPEPVGLEDTFEESSSFHPLQRSSRRPRSYEDGKDIARPNLRRIADFIDRHELVRGKIETFFGKSITVTFDSRHSSQDLKIAHSLGVIPTDILVGSRDVDARVFRGNKEWDNQYIYLRASAACTARVFLVV